MTWHNFLHYDFMMHALYGALTIALLTGIVGFFTVAKRLSFAAHALSHIGFAGAAFALLIGLSPLAGQLGMNLLAALAMALISKNLSKNDMSIAMVLAFALGLGSLFLFLRSNDSGGASSILFGNLLSISTGELTLIVALTFFSLLLLALFSRPLWLITINPEMAAAQGMPLTLYRLLFFALLSVAVSLASQVVGVLLVFTLLIGPAAISLELTRGFWPGLLASIGICAFNVLLAIIFAVITNAPISFWVSALIFAEYIISLLLSSRLKT
jgi:zinc/manganese transport system permease protein